MSFRSKRILTWVLAVLFSVLSLGDRGVHALTSIPHAGEQGSEAPGCDGLGGGESDACSICGFFGEVQALDAPAADAPAQLASLVSARPPSRLDIPPAFPVGSPRAPPRRG